MNTRVVVGILALTILASCARQLSSPHEVVDQSYLHRYGVPISPNDWTAKGETGKVVYSLKSGVVVTKSYVQGVLEGETTYTYPHSDLVEYVETYSGGDLLKRVSFYKNGTPKEEIRYLANGQQERYHWFDNGIPSSLEVYNQELLVKGEYYSLSQGMDSTVENGKGQKTRRDPFGQLEGVDNISNGLLVDSRVFYPEGALKQVIPYTNGEINGLAKTFLPGGEPSIVETWVAGERTGPTLVFENGEKVAEIPYLRGVKQGVEKRFRNGSSVVEEITWLNDQRNGPSTTYVGEIAKTDYYLQGRNVSRSVYEKMTHTATLPN